MIARSLRWVVDRAKAPDARRALTGWAVLTLAWLVSPARSWAEQTPSISETLTLSRAVALTLETHPLLLAGAARHDL